MTIRETLNFAIKKLQNKSTSPSLDAEVLLCFILNKPKEYLHTNPDQQIPAKKYLQLISQRAKGLPVAYLTRQKEFFGLKFYVDKNVLIPRPETEGLLELVLSRMTDHRSQINILDIGTGSGNIIISLAYNLKLKTHNLFASDISAKALAVAKRNARLHKVKISFKHGSLLKPWKNQNFDVIVANLPYLHKESDISTKFEPKSALIAAKKGLAQYEELFKQLSPLTPLPSTLFLEIGETQAKQIKKLAKQILPAFETKISKDLAGRSRYAVLEKKSS